MVKRKTTQKEETQVKKRDHVVLTLPELAYSQLEELIVTLRIAPGTVISEAELSDMLSIGRTPIREALQKLAAQRLVKIMPRRGLVVSEIDVRAQLRLLEIRREVERLICRAAARRAMPDESRRFSELAMEFKRSATDGDEKRFVRIDREFNELCVTSARNEFAASAMHLMQPLSRRFWVWQHKQAADLTLSAKLHADVAKAIAAGDESGAAIASDALIDALQDIARATILT